MIIALLLLLLLAYGLTPRGTLLHEALHLPPFWLSAVFSRTPKARAERQQYGPHPQQYYLLCPASSGAIQPLRLLFYFHGGSWRWGKPDYFTAHARFFNELGYTVVLPSYRRCPKHDYTHIREDLRAVTLHAFAEMDKRGQPVELALSGGMSAGGHLAAMLALSPNGESAGRDIRGFFALGAPLCLADMPESFALRDLAGPRTGSLFAEADPCCSAQMQPHKPALIVHGTHDGMVPCNSTRQFARQRQEASPATTFVKINSGTHLSVAAWIFRQGKTRQAIKAWLQKQATSSASSSV